MSMKQTMCEFVHGMTCDEVCKLVGSIVRCRDCKYADWDITAWWCTRNKHYPFEIGELRGYGERSHLDGFCAWGERNTVEVWKPFSPDDVTCYEGKE